MFYYPRPTPQDVLIEEQDNDHYHQGYSGSDTYEWNIDGLAERQIYTTVHRILLYSTICKVNKKTNRAIAEMIIAEFSGQLKGWWDNYLTHDKHFQIMNATKTEDDKTVQNSVYSLVMNIIEHFSGRWSDNSENAPEFEIVMKLPESNSTHWKSKFIDGLPPLFAKRIRKEGLALCNKIKLNQQIKKHRLTKRQQLGQFCEQFAIDIPSKKKKSQKADFKRKKGSPEKQQEKTQRRKAFHKARKGFIKSKNPQACYKCGRVGDYARIVKSRTRSRNLI
uniref:DUF7746 domain-containing protein n=1 Tax=Nicotiana tabacum TaxID=4097 RepID=A0A1S3ZR97_TOBAC|nr:PREDICTED: uncharacterized protein LOC107789509 [Nicotiana tabacum]